jgi:hypothetical protein
MWSRRGIAMTLAILRQAPGETALLPGTYALVGHFGAPIGYSVKVGKGERLLLTAIAHDGPLWWSLVDISTEAIQAA